MQLVFVDRESADSRKATAASIQQRASGAFLATQRTV